MAREDRREAKSDKAWLIASRIVEARREQGLTQVEFAAAVGASQRSAQAWENAETIPYRWIDRISEVLQRPREWLLGEVHQSSDSEVLALMLIQLVEMREDIAELVALVRQIFRVPPSQAASDA